MSQLRNRWITAEDMVRSRAWRRGYHDFRRGEPPDFDARGSQALAYEYGRQTAAYLTGQGCDLPRVTPHWPINDRHAEMLACALLRCVTRREAADLSETGICENSGQENAYFLARFLRRKRVRPGPRAMP